MRLVAVALTFAGGQAFADPVSPITVTKTATPNPVASGAQLTYTIQMVNTGGCKVNNVVMTDQVQGVGVIQAPPALARSRSSASAAREPGSERDDQDQRGLARAGTSEPNHQYRRRRPRQHDRGVERARQHVGNGEHVPSGWKCKVSVVKGNTVVKGSTVSYTVG